MGRRRRRRSDDGTRGAVLVEAAIILPLVLLLVCGILEFGLAFRNNLTLTSSTRTGARTAVALPRSDNQMASTVDVVTEAMGNVDQGAPEELWIYRANTGGYPGAAGNTSFASCATACNRYTWNGSAFVAVSENWEPTSQNACGAEGDRVGVYVRMEHSFITGLFGASIAMTDHTVMRLEPIPSSSGVTGCKP